MINKLLK